ncbi:hypothetical protein ABPG75_003250 [Micractinium tetrahymenae]
MAARSARLCCRLGAPLRSLQNRRSLCCSALLERASWERRVAGLLDRDDWLLPDPAVPVTSIPLGGGARMAVIRDELTHPLLGGNKFRKLDGLWADVVGQAADVITCGGLQSAHTVAVAAACAERGRRAQLLVRGERPAVPTGHHLYARMLAHRVEYISRARYADRAAMFAGHLERLRQEQQQQARRGSGSGSAADGSSSTCAAGSESSSSGGAGGGGVAVIPEGAACSAALLGLIRLVAWLARHSELAGGGGSSSSSRHSSSGAGDSRGGGGGRVHILVDSGTGATATGLSLGAALLGLPWRVTGVCLAGPVDYYRQQQEELTAAFCAEQWAPTAASGGPAAAADRAAAGAAAAGVAAAEAAAVQRAVADRLSWVPRLVPRRFGKVLPGEVAACRAVAQRHGILLDPIWNLAAWEVASQAAQAAACGDQSGHSSGPGSSGGSDAGEEVVAMLHTGGHLGLCGLAQRFPDQF